MPRRTASPLKVTSAARDGYRLVTVLFRATSTTRRRRRSGSRSTCRPASRAPRATSGSGRRSRRSSPGRSATRGRVRVEVPTGFKVSVVGRRVTRATGSGGTQVLTASTASPLDWYAWVNARNDDGLTREARRRSRAATGSSSAAGPRTRAGATASRAVLADCVPDLVDADRPALAGGRAAHRDRGPHAAPRGLRGLLRQRHRRDHDQRGPRRRDDRPRGVARLVQRRACSRSAGSTRGWPRSTRPASSTALGGDSAEPAAVTRSDPAAFPLNDWPPPAPIRDRRATRGSSTATTRRGRSCGRSSPRPARTGMRRVFRAADEPARPRTSGEAPPERDHAPERLAPLPRPRRGAGRCERGATPLSRSGP